MKYLFIMIILVSLFMAFTIFQNRNIKSGVKQLNNQVLIESSRC